jgi:hypothetical protein
LKLVDEILLGFCRLRFLEVGSYRESASLQLITDGPAHLILWQCIHHLDDPRSKAEEPFSEVNLFCHF